MNKKYVVAWEEKYSTFIVDLAAKIIEGYYKIIGNDIIEYLAFVEKTTHVINFYSCQAQEKINKEHGSYFLDKKRIKKLLLKYDEIIFKYQRLLQRIDELNYSILTENDLKKIWQELIKNLSEIIAYFRSTRPEVEIKPAGLVKKILSEYYPQNEIDEKLRILATSLKIGLIEKERRGWVEILKTKKKKKTQLKRLFLEHVEKFPSFFINIYETDKLINLLYKRFLEDKRNLGKLTREIKEKEKFLKTLPSKQNRIIKKCKNNKDLITFSEMLQDFGWYRFELKDIWAGAEIKFLSLFKEISKRKQVELFDLLNYYTIEDISNCIEGRKKLSKKELEKRKKCIAFVVKNHKYKLITGKEALSLLNRIEKNLLIEKELKGNPAYPGVVRGRVKIVFPENMAEGTKKFNNGDILVTTNTQPSMVPLIAKAGAIINDIGGITSHAAIVSRELKIPCIVGTKTGSKVLKDGDLVEVDANKGIVKIIKKAH